jgi:hypothetical protein
LKFQEFINEAMLSDIRVDNVINDKFISTVLSDSYNEESLKYQYMDEESISDEDDIVEDDFNDWVKYELNLLASDFMDNAKRNLIKNGKLKIWRAMTVSREWESRLSSQVKHLGIYWTWDRSSAEPHWGHSNDMPFTTIMEAEVDEIAVDWEPTIRLNTEPVSYEEKEIRLVKGAKINLTSIEIDGEKIDISELSGERFIA